MECSTKPLEKKVKKVTHTDLGQYKENESITEQATPEELEWAYEKGSMSLAEALTMISNNKRGAES
jgi:hypothetical protein